MFTWLASISLLLLIPAIWLLSHKTTHQPPNHLRDSTIHLLIAHPDDEAMFFAPTVLTLTSPSLNNTLKVLCLSTGNAENLGPTRREELLASCAILGVPGTHVESFDHPELQDCMDAYWPSKRIVEILAQRGVENVITFDEGGVSGHRNHVSLFRGATEYVGSCASAGRRLYTLTSVPIWRKYVSVLDAPASFWVRRGKSVVFVSSFGGYQRAREAMARAHVSQMRWFRWGWISASRYMVVNDLVLREREVSE